MTTSCTTCLLTRRQFVSVSAVGTLGALLTACGDGETSTTAPTTGPGTDTVPGATRAGNVWTIDVPSASGLSSRGLLILLGGARPALVVRVGSNSYVAYDAACPHAGTIVAWQAQGNAVRCTNHGSEFAAATGVLARGPATSGLRPLPITRTGDILTVTVG